MTRRLLWLALVVVVLAAAYGVARAAVDDFAVEHAPGWISRAVYPLEHDADIRDAARKNRVDPALVAAVIYVESGFDDSPWADPRIVMSS